MKAAAEYEFELNRKSYFSVFGHLLLFFNEIRSPAIFLKDIIDSFSVKCDFLVVNQNLISKKKNDSVFQKVKMRQTP